MRQSPLFSNISTGDVYASSDTATYGGITAKTIILLAITIVIGCITAFYLPEILANQPSGLLTALIASSIIGFISVLVGRTSVKAAPYCSVIYAVCEGLFLGTITTIFDGDAQGIAVIAVVSTVTLFATMLILYATGIIKVGNKMRRFLWGLIIGALALTLVTSLLYLTPVMSSIPVPLVLGLELFFLFYGVFTLLLNFKEATNVVEAGCEKQAEWSVALGLEVSVVYIYVQILRFAYYLYIMFGRNK